MSIIVHRRQRLDMIWLTISYLFWVQASSLGKADKSAPRTASASTVPKATTALPTPTASRSKNAVPKKGPLQVFVSTVQEARRHLAAAAAARSTSVFFMYPVDCIKTRMQMGQANPLRIEGIFNGVAGSLIGQVPYG